MEKIRLRYIFRGTVQGVGFRYYAFHAANMFGVTGFVRNLADGGVELEAEGDIVSIGNMLEKIQSGRFIVIDSIEHMGLQVQGSETFEIVR